jgi:hypothetical protein
MKNAALVLAVFGIASLFAGTVSAHGYGRYHGYHHGYHRAVVVAPRAVVVAPPVVFGPRRVVTYAPYGPVVVPAPVYPVAPWGGFNYYGPRVGISVGF